MSVIGLFEYLSLDSRLDADGRCDLWKLRSDAFFVPGFWVSLAALADKQQKKYSDIDIGSQKGYCEAIGLHSVLGEEDNYPYERHNQGTNYSGLVLLESCEAVDKATCNIGGCIENLCSGILVDRFAEDLCEIVGELHDNVWSHGKSRGFSMAQKWKKPYAKNEFLFEFAIADCGIGFLKELRRVGLTVENDQQAIDWCLERGNSSKIVSAASNDSWAQRLPPDIINNPMPGVGRVKESDNNHQGLGLAKLVGLVDAYRGSLWLCSGKAMLTRIASRDGETNYSIPGIDWQGVTLACRFDTSLIRQHMDDSEKLDDITSGFIELLGG